MKSVSVIVPVYNVEKYLARCLDSLLGQTQPDIEILVVNDGSTDTSGRIVDEYAQKYPDRIRAFHMENEGVSAARNRGVAEAEGKYLTFVDSDDYVTVDYLERMVEAAEKNHADLVVQGFRMVDESGNVLAEVCPTAYIPGKKEEWPLRIISAWGRLFRRGFWMQHNLNFPLGVRAEDAPVNLAANALAHHIQVVPRAGYQYFQHSASAMHNFKGLQEYRLPYEALEKTLQYIQETGLVNDRYFYEYCVMRILAFWVFEFARGSSVAKIKELCHYIMDMLNTYIPEYMRNPYVNPFRKLEIPFVHRASIWVLAVLCKLHILTPVIRVYAKLLH